MFTTALLLCILDKSISDGEQRRQVAKGQRKQAAEAKEVRDKETEAREKAEAELKGTESVRMYMIYACISTN